MYLEPNNPSLSFANFLDAAIRDKAEIKPFPYTLEVCRCRYCSYCQNGKCALNSPSEYLRSKLLRGGIPHELLKRFEREEGSV